MHGTVRGRLIGIAGIGALALLTACAPQSADAPAATRGCSSRDAAAFDPRDFSGTWDRYPLATDTQRDPTTVTMRRPGSDSAAAAEAGIQGGLGSRAEEDLPTRMRAANRSPTTTRTASPTACRR